MDTYVCTDIYTNTCIHTIHTDTKHTVSIAHTCNTVHTHTHKTKHQNKESGVNNTDPQSSHVHVPRMHLPTHVLTCTHEAEL